MQRKIDRLIEARKQNATNKRVCKSNSLPEKLSGNVVENNLYDRIMYTNERYHKTSSMTSIREDPEEVESYHLRQLANIRSNPWRTLPIKVKMECLEDYLSDHEVIHPITQTVLTVDDIRIPDLKNLSVKYSTKQGKILDLRMRV